MPAGSGVRHGTEPAAALAPVQHFRLDSKSASSSFRRKAAIAAKRVELASIQERKAQTELELLEEEEEEEELCFLRRFLLACFLGSSVWAVRRSVRVACCFATR